MNGSVGYWKISIVWCSGGLEVSKLEASMNRVVSIEVTNFDDQG